LKDAAGQKKPDRNKSLRLLRAAFCFHSFYKTFVPGGLCGHPLEEAMVQIMLLQNAPTVKENCFYEVFK
jgi:ABC-type Co2+ transport system permease subunit